MNRTSASDVWSFFDHIYCICLKQREKRRQQAAAQFALVGLGDRVIFRSFDLHPSDPEEGIYTSHMACIREALADGARHILIFEDDIIFERLNAARLHAALAFLRHQRDWQILFLGCMVKKSRPTQCPALREVKYRCLAHAYSLNRLCAEVLVERAWKGVPFDNVLSDFTGGTYACYPTFAFQSNAESSNRRLRRMDQFRRLCGGLRRLQKFDEWYNCNKILLITLHLVGLGLLLWIVCC
ncbi:MAG: glycosyltransferase family 25 protein [Syntrophobacteraceae bacterium]